MAADPWQVYASLVEFAGDGTVDLDNDTFVAILLDSGHTPDVNTHDELADVVGDELASTNGYERQTLTGVTWVRSGANVTFTCNPFVFEADGGPIVARYCAIFDDTSSGDKLVAICLLDDSPADVTVTDGNTLTITPHASTGIVQYQANPA